MLQCIYALTVALPLDWPTVRWKAQRTIEPFCTREDLKIIIFRSYCDITKIWVRDLKHIMQDEYSKWDLLNTQIISSSCASLSLFQVCHRWLSSGLQLFSCRESAVSGFHFVYQLVASFLLLVCCVLSASAVQDHDCQHVAEQRATHKHHQQPQESAHTHTRISRIQGSELLRSQCFNVSSCNAGILPVSELVQIVVETRRLLATLFAP